jgi:polysaccharide export outer membrane protein
MLISKTHQSITTGLLLLLLSGCTVFPGSHLSTSDKNTVEEEQSDDTQNQYSTDVNVYELLRIFH